MRKMTWLVPAVGVILAGGWTASATDYWDASSITDNGPIDTFNELAHGLSQQHDLEANPGPVADEDWLYGFNAPRSSYEVIVDSASADIGMASTSLQRIDAAGTTVVQTSEAGNVGAPVPNAMALRWENTNAAFALNYVRVRTSGSGCGPTCTAAAQYRIRFHDTTVAVPRFNNAGGQVTVLIIQNPTSWTRNISGTVYFWSTTGTLLGNSAFSLSAKAATVLNTSTVPGVGGAGGTITITHDGGYGNLAIKSVALEPSTGFSFDSLGVYKPQ